MNPELFDVAILGAGPVGLFGCFYAGMRGMKTLLIDSLTEPGGQLAALYPEKYVFDMPGFPKVLAKDLAKEMTEQGLRFEPTTVLGCQIETLDSTPQGWQLGHMDGAFLAKSVVICAGAGAFSPKKMNARGLAEFEGRGVHYFVKDKSALAGKRLLIVGGGDSAVDWAMNLQETAKSITLIHRRDQFRAHEESVDWLLNRSGLDVRLFHELDSVAGSDVVQSAVILDNRAGTKSTLDVDAVLLNIGFHASIGPIRNWGLNLEHGHIVVDRRQQTNLPGVFAAGDICTFDGKLKLIATGVGEVCTAINFAKVYGDPDAKLFPGHSSNMGL